MCRNIRTLLHFEPPATDEEIQAAALQYVRKVLGITRPSARHREAFDRAVADVARITTDLVRGGVVILGPARSREAEAEKARARGRQREERVRRKLAEGA